MKDYQPINDHLNNLINFETNHKQWKFKYWEYKSREVTGEADRWWAEYYFEDEEGLGYASSPVYSEGALDFECLFEDAPLAALRLRAGEDWETVSYQTFRTEYSHIED